MIRNIARHNRLADSSPVPDVEGSDEIGFSINTTGNASKMGSFRPVLLICCVTIGAFPAGGVRADHDDGNAHFPCPVLHEQPDLVERPRIMDVPVAFPNGCPHPNSTEVFNGNCGGGAFGFMHDLTGYYMVGIPDDRIQYLFICGGKIHANL